LNHACKCPRRRGFLRPVILIPRVSSRACRQISSNTVDPELLTSGASIISSTCCKRQSKECCFITRRLVVSRSHGPGTRELLRRCRSLDPPDRAGMSTLAALEQSRWASLPAANGAVFPTHSPDTQQAREIASRANTDSRSSDARDLGRNTPSQRFRSRCRLSHRRPRFQLPFPAAGQDPGADFDPSACSGAGAGSKHSSEPAL